MSEGPTPTFFPKFGVSTSKSPHGDIPATVPVAVLGHGRFRLGVLPPSSRAGAAQAIRPFRALGRRRRGAARRAGAAAQAARGEHGGGCG